MERNAETRKANKTNKTVGYNYNMRIEIIRKKGDVDIKDLKHFGRMLSNRSVTIGIHQNEGQKVNFWSGTKVIDYACYNEFGHPENAGADGKPPSRKFVRRLLYDSDTLEKIKAKGREHIHRIARNRYKDTGGKMAKDLYADIGLIGLEQMQYYIADSFTWAIPNAPKTIKKKGFDHPLHDTGLLATCLRAKVRGKNGSVQRTVKSSKFTGVFASRLEGAR